MRAPEPESTLAKQFPPPESQWTEQYAEDHRNLVTAVLADPGVLTRFELAELLPRFYGIGYDERVVEYPWALAQGPTGRVLDAGSTLNHARVLDHFLPRLAALQIVSISPETNDFRDRGVSYMQADLRDLPYEDDSFDTVISLSTLEHVGIDNAFYGVKTPPDSDPNSQGRLAADELSRVVRTGGTVLFTVPFGKRENHGWFRQFDAGDLEDLLARFGSKSAEIRIYRYASTGWQLSNLKSAVNECYRDFRKEPEAPPDRAAAARAVACVRLGF
jgi:SAM-dependent methyltransferase